jgi:hypothetical protein
LCKDETEFVLQMLDDPSALSAEDAGVCATTVEA